MILRSLLALWTSAARPIGDHLWQSTLFVCVAATVAFALRKNQAHIRYWVWLAASVKFLVPFSLLIAFGGHLAKPRASAPPQRVIYSAVEDFSQPFAGRDLLVMDHPAMANAPASWHRLLPAIVVAVWLAGVVIVLLRWIVGWFGIALVVRKAASVSEGPEIDTLRRLESSLHVRTPLSLVLSRNWMEPGIFGIFRPVLIWPAGISQFLDEKHIEAIVAHELCHARRRDNLTAVFHMLVEAVFWFHPVVWWIGARLEEERERACDEEITLLCDHPHVYAESILRVCKFCSESPLACVSGITGADLKKRIAQIMTKRLTCKLDLGRRFLLWTISVGVIASPIALGMIHTLLASGQTLYTDGPLPSFEVATIRPMPNGYLPTPTPHGGSIVRLRFTPKMMIGYAYNLPDFSEGRILNGAGWTDDNYEVEGKISDSDYSAMQKMTPDEKNRQIQLMVQSLLKDRMRLKVHLEKREETVYALEVAKGGMKLSPAQEGKPQHQFGVTHQGQNYQLTTKGGTLYGLALLLGRQPEIGGRTIVDKTGMTGLYDATLHWTRTGSATAMTDNASNQDENGPTFFTAIQEQLGLRLATTKGQVDYLIVDHIERPSVDGAELSSPGPSASSPVLIRSIKPEFTERALQAHASGDVLVHLLVDEEGNPKQVRTVRGLGMGLDQKAIEAVQQYRFIPALHDGKPVPAQLTVAVKFQIF